MSEEDLKWKELATNLEYNINQTKIMFKADFSKILRKSKSGKTDIITTCGRPKPITLEDGSSIYVNLTIYKYPDVKQELK